jgi:hypothetical protein
VFIRVNSRLNRFLLTGRQGVISKTQVVRNLLQGVRTERQGVRNQLQGVRNASQGVRKGAGRNGNPNVFNTRPEFAVKKRYLLESKRMF